MPIVIDFRLKCAGMTDIEASTPILQQPVSADDTSGDTPLLTAGLFI